MTRTDYLDIADDGLIVRGTSIEGGGRALVQFGDEAPIPVPAYVRNLVVRRDGTAAAFKSQDGMGYEVSRRGDVSPLGPIYGDEALAYSPSGQLAYITSATRWAVDGVSHMLPPNRQGTSQGIREFHDDGTVVWSDSQYEAPITRGPIRFVTWRQIGNWIVGNSHIGCAAWHIVRAQAYILPQCNGTSWTLRGAMVRGELQVVSSQPAMVVGEREFVPYVKPEPVYAPVVRIGRPMWFGFFEFTPAIGLPRNCVVPVVQGAEYLAVSGSYGPDWYYVSGDPDGDPAAIERAIRRVSRPSLAYVPQKAFHALPTSADLQGIECYLWSGEDDETFLRVRSEMIRKCERVVLIAQCYDNGHPSPPDLRRVPGLVSKLARDHANVEGILVFSGSGRATGWQDHPEVHDPWRQVFAGITGAPARKPTPAPTPTPEPVPPTAPEPTPCGHIDVKHIDGMWICLLCGESVPKPAWWIDAVPADVIRPDTPISGNAIADVFRWLSRINVRKWFR